MTSIIIVNYMKYEDVFDCVSSIRKSKTNEQYSIIIVENCSPNDSWQKLQDYKNDSDIVLLKSEENKGYCAGNNIGIKYALENQNPDFIWILNPDTVIDKFTLDRLNSYAKTKQNLGILGAKIVYYPDSSLLQGLGGGNYSFQKYGDLAPDMHLFHLQPADTKLPDEVQIDLINGASMYVPAKIFKEIGLMNERFFMYSDENEFCIRVKDAGYKSYAISSAVVYHKEGIRQSKKSKEKATYYLIRNQLFMTEQLRPDNLSKKKFAAFMRCLSLIKHLEFNLLWFHICGIIDYYLGKDGKTK